MDPEDRLVELEEALGKIESWSRAYPLRCSRSQTWSTPLRCWRPAA
jgi:hypothetical protein